MAAKYKKVDPRIWDDEKFTLLTVEQQHAVFYILTNPHVNRIGLYKLSVALMAEYLKVDGPTAMGLIRSVCQALGWKWDEPSKVVYLPTWWKYNLPENPSVLAGNLKDLHDLPASPLVDEFRANTTYLGTKLAATFLKTCQTRVDGHVPHQEQEQEQEQEQDQEQDFLPDTGQAQVEEETVMTFPRLGGGTWPLPRSLLDIWRDTYRGVNVEAECRKALAWLHSNRLKKDVKRFLNSWLARANDRGESKPKLQHGYIGAPPRIPSAEELAALDRAGE